MNLSLKLIKGPLDLALLQGICDTYGENDSKYKSLEFCDHIFNRNEMGCSFHVFAVSNESNKIVGHFGVVPMKGHFKGSEILMGKAEAFYLHKDYRNSPVTVDGNEIHPSIAMAKMLYQFTNDQGVALIHLRARREIFAIHKLAGCKGIPFNVISTFLPLNDKSKINGLKTLVKKSYFQFQILLHILNFKISRLLFKSPDIFSLKDHPDILEEIAQRYQPKNTESFDIALTGHFRNWLLD